MWFLITLLLLAAVIGAAAFLVVRWVLDWTN